MKLGLKISVKFGTFTRKKYQKQDYFFARRSLAGTL
jgi:hypothetical protein